jgi:hypothetical protein
MMDSKQAAMAAWQAFGSRDPERIRAVLTEDAEWIAPADNATQLMLGLGADFLGAADAGGGAGA